MAKTDQAKTGSVENSPEGQNERRMRLMKKMGEIEIPLSGRDMASGAGVEERLDKLRTQRT